jgi:hypothetical protein
MTSIKSRTSLVILCLGIAYLLCSQSYAQSGLPACLGSDLTRWTGCAGSAVFSNGDKYFGQYENGYRHGFGTYLSKNGEKYVGEFKYGQPNGNGALTYPNGVVKKGVWVNDQLVREESQSYSPTTQQLHIESSFSSVEVDRLKQENDEFRKKQKALEAQLEKQRDQSITPIQVTNPNKGSSAQTTKSVAALIIGNASYSKSPLLNPTNDANEIAKRFIQYGFNVKILLDGDRKSIIRALNDFQNQSSKYDVSILFYAGHGIQYNGINYLIPTDMSLDAGVASIEFEGISANQIVDKYMRGKTKLVFLDACRDNPLSRSLQVASRGGSNSRGLAAMDANSGTLISYSTKDGNVALDGNTKNSPYTESLLRYLDNREDISLILRKVRQSVIDKTGGKQVPWDYGSLVGDQLILSNK